MSNNPDDDSVDGRALPTRKDIFVEVDYMDGHEMSDEAKWRVGTRFLNNPTGDEIWLHLDDGLMGGGEEIEHRDPLSETEFKQDLYNSNYNGNHGFTQSRKGKFHYCVFADEIWTGRSGINPSSVKETFVVADGHSLVDDVTAQAGTFMHELGHSLGLTGTPVGRPGYFKGIDEEYNQDYKSCMNYEYQTTLIDYSDGSNGAKDHDDWADVMQVMDIWI